MDVTSKNFLMILEELDLLLEEASFVSIDTELTGLHDGARLSQLDTPEQRYAKVRDGSMKFLIIQFGLAAFQYHKDSNKYTYKAYNFYIFPNSTTFPGCPDPKFLCQSSSLSFLIEHGFDFNKLIKEGIPYLPIADEERCKKNLEERHKLMDINSTPVNRLPSIPSDQTAFMESIFTRIQMFIDGEDESLCLENCSAFQRKLIFTHARQKFPEVHLESMLTEKRERAVSVRRADTEMRLKLFENQKKSEWVRLENAVGFSKVLHKISQSGKLVVGHNMLLDVCHILHQFYADLPPTYEEFKVMTKTILPKMIDTKVMASTLPFREMISNTALQQLLRTLSEKPFRLGCVEAAPDFPGYTINSDKAHEAGYDAFMTGLCFIAMSNYLGELGGKDHQEVEAVLLEPFVQKLHLGIFDIPYLNLNGEDVQPERDHVFHLTFPKEWKTSDIVELFSVYGPVYVSWIDDTSAFVSLQRKENKALVMKNLVTPTGCTIVPYLSHVRSISVDCDGEVDTESKTETVKRIATVDLQTPPCKKKRNCSPGNTTKTEIQFDVPDNWM